ncbi:unnamed protein product [Urochloa decumbens]|uniref:F-box domain-containing protein n=1 Tax=Urochloa decumbens TaxID=240449 RepID=A0ABC8VYL7_9POAL
MPYASIATSFVQWSELPQDACSNIIQFLDVLDLQRFSAVCTTWSATCSNINSPRLKSGNPTLLTSRMDHYDGRSKETLVEGTFGLHDVTECTSFCVYNKSLKHRTWVGGKDDWLVTSDKRCSLQLLNPITGETVPLPSFDTIDGIEIDQYSNLSIASEPYNRTLRRVVLCQTPSSSSGHLALSLFDDGVLAYTTKSDNMWFLVDHSSSYFGSCNYIPDIYMDALIHKGSIVAVDNEGFVFSWHMGDKNATLVKATSADIPVVIGSDCRVFYLAKSPGDQQILICVQGHGPVSSCGDFRVLKSEHDRFKNVDSITLFRFDDVGETWRRIHTSDLGASLFVGINHPFYVTCDGIKPNSLHVANIIDHDVAIFGTQGELDMPIEVLNYPIKEEAQSYKIRQGMRTSMWFRPTVPVK